MRRLRKILFFIILSAWTLTSCEKDTGTETVNVPIGFSNNITTATKAGDINNDNLTSIGVFASLTHGNFDATVSTPNFMYNQLVEKKNGTWQYTPLKYWPNNDSDKISFFAYAPHNATGVTPSNATQKGYPSFTYTTPTAEADQVDLLAATPIINQNGGSVDFKMQHALTKVVFNCRQTMTTRVSVGLIRQRLLPKHLPLPQNPCPYRIKVLRRKLCYVPTSCSPQI